MTPQEILEKALVAIKDRKFDKASWLLTECLKAKPDFAEAWEWAGSLRMIQERNFDAVLCFEKALNIEPDRYASWTNMGAAFAYIGAWGAAEKALVRSIGIHNAIEPHMHLANMYCHLMRLPEAELEYHQALSINPEHHDARVNLGLSQLGQRKWTAGWDNYAKRHDDVSSHILARKIPQWGGEDLSGKTIVLYPEQGFGDEIMTMRSAVILKQMYPEARVILQARPPLYRLAKTVPGADEVTDMHTESKADYSCSLFDVFAVNQADPSAVVGSIVPYLTGRKGWSDPRRGYKVGICWSSGQRELQPETAGVAQAKSIPLEWLKPLVMPGVQLIALQKDHSDHETMKSMGIVDGMVDVHDFADTAAIINGLDLVISVDTAVAHLAGAMGKAVWNFVRFNAYWPWMSEGMAGTSETIWYPHMRIYRQPRIGDWEEPIARMAGRLTLVLKNRKE